VPRLDHLVVTAPSLAAGIAAIEHRLGVRAAGGGSHLGWGTCNALLALGARRYLEVLAPDPEQPAPAGGRFLGIDERTRVRLATWVARASDLEDVARRAGALGLDLGAPIPGSRRGADGTLLSWRLLGPAAPRMDGLIPFFIDWGDAPHPASVAPAGVTLRALRAEHRDPEPVRSTLHALGLDVDVAAGPESVLIATLETPHGLVTLGGEEIP
jgi:hypothetical protein